MLAAYRSVGRRMRAPGHVRFASAISGLNLPAKYGHFIGGKFVEPVGGEYFDNVSPIDGQKFIQAARGSKADVDDAVRAANEAYWYAASSVGKVDPPPEPLETPLPCLPPPSLGNASPRLAQWAPVHRRCTPPRRQVELVQSVRH